MLLGLVLVLSLLRHRFVGILFIFCVASCTKNERPVGFVRPQRGFFQHTPWGTPIFSHGNGYTFAQQEQVSGLGVMDFYARTYSTNLARMNGIDPVALSSVIRGESPFVYAYNHPLGYTDPTGRVGQNAQEKSVEARIKQVRETYKLNTTLTLYVPVSWISPGSPNQNLPFLATQFGSILVVAKEVEKLSDKQLALHILVQDQIQRYLDSFFQDEQRRWPKITKPLPLYGSFTHALGGPNWPKFVAQGDTTGLAKFMDKYSGVLGSGTRFSLEQAQRFELLQLYGYVNVLFGTHKLPAALDTDENTQYLFRNLIKHYVRYLDLKKQTKTNYCMRPEQDFAVLALMREIYETVLQNKKNSKEI